MTNIVSNRIKFAIYSLMGEEKAYYIADKLRIDNLYIEEPLAIDYSYQVFLSESAKIIKCTAGILKINDLKPDNRGIIFKYKQISKETFAQLEIPVVQNHQAVYAFTKANLMSGNWNLAKYALFSTFNQKLIDRHAKALTNQELASFERDIETAIFSHQVMQESDFNLNQNNNRISLLELIQILEKHRHSIIVNLKHLRENYQYQSVKRVKGYRDANGNLLKPWLKTEYIDEGDYVDMGCFEINRNTATINMLVTRKVKLVKTEDETPVIEIAGLLANDLTSYNNYTVVSDRQLNIKSLKVKISSKKTFDLLKHKGIIAAESFDFRSEYIINLENLPLVSLDGKYRNIDGLFNQLAEIKILASIISAHLKQESDTFVPEQLDELKKHYLSENLYLNFPTVKAEGTIDTKVSYKIDIGSKDILNLSKLYSANKFLERRYEVYDTETGEIFSKPTFEMTLRENIAVRQKPLSPRMKVTKVDELMKPIFDDFLGIDNNGKVAGILEYLENLSPARKEALNSPHSLLGKGAGGLGKQEKIAALTATKVKLDEYVEKIYQDKISPLVFYIGSTGLLPDGMEGKAMSAIQLAALCPNLSFSKDESEGLFFEVGDSLIGIYEKVECLSRKSLASVG
ncbi:hypothetical protein Riv7116_4102 [Rivularia sp. PCC 7116]|uniref:hypothetical protein n=1 Tax=Rivularia sp. PCC 7116 TaxID=373994 RepID=UPI00029F1C5B|nr:hypothetical protein [Rivularia sp. PCC 7116]AFY56536.1 hypothetical protein Riv7116_4102 [Rivularia sp. PCC 7116]